MGSGKSKTPVGGLPGYGTGYYDPYGGLEYYSGYYPTGGYTGYLTTAVVPAAPIAPIGPSYGLAPKIRAIFIPQGGGA